MTARAARGRRVLPWAGSGSFRGIRRGRRPGLPALVYTARDRAGHRALNPCGIRPPTGPSLPALGRRRLAGHRGRHLLQFAQPAPALAHRRIRPASALPPSRRRGSLDNIAQQLQPPCHSRRSSTADPRRSPLPKPSGSCRRSAAAWPFEYPRGRRARKTIGSGAALVLGLVAFPALGRRNASQAARLAPDEETAESRDGENHPGHADERQAGGD